MISPAPLLGADEVLAIAVDGDRLDMAAAGLGGDDLELAAIQGGSEHRPIRAPLAAARKRVSADVARNRRGEPGRLGLAAVLADADVGRIGADPPVDGNERGYPLVAGGGVAARRCAGQAEAMTGVDLPRTDS